MPTARSYKYPPETVQQAHEMHQAGMQSVAVAAALGVQATTVRRWAKRGGWGPWGTTYEPELIEHARVMHGERRPLAEVSAAVGVSIQILRRWGQKGNWGPWYRPGEERHSAAYRQRARQLYEQRVSLADIAGELHLAWRTIRRWAEDGHWQVIDPAKMGCEACKHYRECRDRVRQGLNCCCEELIEIEDVHESHLWSQNGGYGIPDVGWTSPG